MPSVSVILAEGGVNLAQFSGRDAGAEHGMKSAALSAEQGKSEQQPMACIQQPCWQAGLSKAGVSSSQGLTGQQGICIGRQIQHGRCGRGLGKASQSSTGSRSKAPAVTALG